MDDRFDNTDPASDVGADRDERIEVERIGGWPVTLRREVEEELPDGTVIHGVLVEHVFLTSSGDLALTPEQVAGVCAVCVEEGMANPFVSRAHAAYCDRCGRLLCLRHQQLAVRRDEEGREREVTLCPTHSVRFGHVVLGCLALLIGSALIAAAIFRGCAG